MRNCTLWLVNSSSSVTDTTVGRTTKHVRMYEHSRQTHTCKIWMWERERGGERDKQRMEYNITIQWASANFLTIYKSVNSYNYICILNVWYQLLLADSLTYKSTTLSSQLCKALNLHGEWFIEWAILWSAWGFASSVCITKSIYVMGREREHCPTPL